MVRPKDHRETSVCYNGGGRENDEAQQMRLEFHHETTIPEESRKTVYKHTMAKTHSIHVWYIYLHLPTFTIKNQSNVSNLNIPYMDGIGKGSKITRCKYHINRYIKVGW